MPSKPGSTMIPRNSWLNTTSWMIGKRMIEIGFAVTR